MDTRDDRRHCASCGVEVSEQHHFKRRGEYLCSACYEPRRQSARRKTAAATNQKATNEKAAEGATEKLYRCVFCDAEVARRDCHKNRYGEYVCRTCHGQGKRWSQSKSPGQMASRWGIRVLYAALVLVGLAAAYVILSESMQAISSSAE